MCGFLTCAKEKKLTSLKGGGGGGAGKKKVAS